VQLFRGEYRDALAHADRSLALSTEHRINLYGLYSRFARGFALARMGQKGQAITEARQGIEEAVRSNLGHMRGFMLGWFATIQLEAGDPDAALLVVDDALKQIDDVAGRAWEAELWRLRGDILMLARPLGVEEAERSHNRAIGIAQSQRARSFELRATMSLTRLLRTQDRTNEAQQRLAAVLGWFREGYETEDLKSAQVLLSSLE
jgi:predicted negative regulator of RcsB-dependent stress response